MCPEPEKLGVIIKDAFDRYGLLINRPYLFFNVKKGVNKYEKETKK